MYLQILSSVKLIMQTNKEKKFSLKQGLDLIQPQQGLFRWQSTESIAFLPFSVHSSLVIAT